MVESGTVDAEGRPPDPNPHPKCLKGITEHAGRARRYWNRTQKKWFTLCLDCKLAREKLVLKNPKLKGTGSNPGKQTRDVAQAKWEDVAALVGAGMTDGAIAAKLDLKPNYVTQIRTKRIEENQRLTEVLEDARLERQQKVVPKALNVVEQLVDQISERANGYSEDAVSKDGVVTVRRMPGPKDLAPALREVANVAGLTRGGEFSSSSAPDRQQGTTQITVNQIIVDSATQQAVMQQLWGWRKELAAKKREALLADPIEAQVVAE